MKCRKREVDEVQKGGSGWNAERVEWMKCRKGKVAEVQKGGSG